MTLTHSRASSPCPSIGHNRPPDGKRQEIIDQITDYFLAERGTDRPSYLDAIYGKAEVSVGGSSPPPDPVLTDLFLFEEGCMPLHTNLLNQELGNFTERLVKTIFETTRGDIVDSSEATMAKLQTEYLALQSLEARCGKNEGKPVEWKKPDFLFGASKIVEIKYRFNSYQAKQKQIQVGLAYKALGFTPVFLHLSPDFRHHKEFADLGWEVYSGEDMIEYVFDHTGYDLRDLLREVSAQPVVRQRLLEAREKMVEDQKSRLWSSYKFAPDDIREDFHSRFVQNAPSLEAVVAIAQKPPDESRDDTTLDLSGLSALTEALSDRAMKTPPQSKKDALIRILMTLEDDERAEVLSEAMRQSSDRTQMTVMSVFG